MRKPIDIDDARKRLLLAFPPKKGVGTFSNGSAGYGWMECNCFECWFYDDDVAGNLCAFEAALTADWVTPALAEMFGWVQDEKYPEWWRPPDQCPSFHQRPEKGDDGEHPAPPPDPDPLQLVLVADPTEIIAGLVPSLVPKPKRKVCQTA